MLGVFRSCAALCLIIAAVSGCADDSCSSFYAGCVKKLPLGSSASNLPLVPAQNIGLACQSTGRYFATQPGWVCRGPCSPGLPESDPRACGGPRCDELGSYPERCGDYLVFAGSDGFFWCGAFALDGGIVAVRAFCAD